MIKGYSSTKMMENPEEYQKIIGKPSENHPKIENILYLQVIFCGFSYGLIGCHGDDDGILWIYPLVNSHNFGK